MKHSFITIGPLDILNREDLTFYAASEPNESKTTHLWEEFLRARGFLATEGKDPLKELFAVIQEEFALTYGKPKPVSFCRGFIVSTSTHNALKHKEASRIFSFEDTVYIDSLMESILYDFSIIFYLLGRFPDDTELRAETFILALYLLNECCRKGQFTDYTSSSLIIKLVNERLKDNELSLIHDLYLCMLSFAICHELGHIYCDHFKAKQSEDPLILEYEADSAGYNVFLNLLLKNKGLTENVISSIFQENLYTAPMVLFLFYHCLFSTEYLLYGEQIGCSHPYPVDRINHLLDISQQPQYDFDTHDGNTVLHAYWDAMDYYISELDLKIKNHKLDKIIERGKES